MVDTKWRNDRQATSVTNQMKNETEKREGGKPKIDELSSSFFSPSLSSFFPSVETQSREKSMAVRNQWRGHAYICPVNAIQLYSHVSTPDCALFILLNDTRLGRNGVRHPYPYPPCYGHVKFSVPSFIRVKGSSTGREIDGNVEIKSCYIEMRRDQLRLDQLLFDRLIRKENVERFFS